MIRLDCWHPVARSVDLRAAPIGARVGDAEVVVFRGADGRLGALDDRCPHRGMRLSLGTVQPDGCLACPYHGWAFAPDGTGRCPATPALTPRAPTWDVVERDGAVWVKRGGPADFPDLGGRGWAPVTVLRHRAKAPLELVLDNFTEVEHTGRVHAFFGYAEADLAAVETRVEARDDAVRVYNRGPQRDIGRALRGLLGIRPGDHFVDDWTTRFAPVHVCYDQYWVDPATGAPRPRRLRVAVVFVPVGPAATDLFTFVYTNAGGGARGLLADRLLRPLLVGFTDLEVRLDLRLVGRLADRATALTGRRLGRFDKVLGEHRRRIDRLYRRPREAE